MTLTTLFFDMGGVLIDFSHDKMCKNVASYCNIEEADVMNLLYDQGLGIQYERGEIDSKELHRHFCYACNKPIELEGLLHAAADIFTDKPEMNKLLRQLKEQGLRLFLLSNTNEAHFLWAEKHFSFLKFFDGFILSYKEKIVKPEKEIFEFALAKANATKEESFYIDDLKENVEAARNLGIDSHLFEGKEKLVKALAERGYVL